MSYLEGNYNPLDFLQPDIAGHNQTVLNFQIARALSASSVEQFFERLPFSASDHRTGNLLNQFLLRQLQYSDSDSDTESESTIEDTLAIWNTDFDTDEYAIPYFNIQGPIPEAPRQHY